MSNGKPGRPTNQSKKGALEMAMEALAAIAEKEAAERRIAEERDLYEATEAAREARAKYTPEIHDARAFSLCRKGATYEEIAEAMGVTIRTIYRWQKTKDASGATVMTSFGKACMEGRGPANDRVVHALYARAVGYEYEEVEQTIEMQPDGTASPVRIKKTIKRAHPDSTAAMYWLNNTHRKTGEWSQKQEVALIDERTNVLIEGMTEEEMRQHIETMQRVKEIAEREETDNKKE